mgnify:CR=1 FL=1
MEVNQLEKNTQKYKIGSTDEHTNKYGHQHWFRISFVGNLYGIKICLGRYTKKGVRKITRKIYMDAITRYYILSEWTNTFWHHTISQKI